MVHRGGIFQFIDQFKFQIKNIKMRPLTDEETKIFFEKLNKYIGDNIKLLVERADGTYCFRLHRDRSVPSSITCSSFPNCSCFPIMFPSQGVLRVRANHEAGK